MKYSNGFKFNITTHKGRYYVGLYLNNKLVATGSSDNQQEAINMAIVEFLS